MIQDRFERFVRWVIPRLPRRFQDGPQPYLFFVVWLLILVMLILGSITPYANGKPFAFGFAFFLFVLQALYIRGLSMTTTMNLGSAAGVLMISYTAWTAGGIFSPRIAWLTTISLVPFYVRGRRVGMLWLCVTLLDALFIAYITWRGWLHEEGPPGQPPTLFSFATYTVVTFIVATVPFLYDNLSRRIYNARAQRHEELEEKRKELMRTSELREQFISTVSHELRTPMNAILGFNNMLLARVKDNPQALKILNHTRQSADHLLTVINDVLDYSQLQAGKINVQSETFALRDTVNTAFDLFAQRIESSHVTYTCIIDDDVPHWVRADRHRLMQILVNLLGNAIKFTHQGHVTLRVRNQPLCVYFSVNDTGIGIDPKQQAHIFQRFVQANNEIQSRYGGNGLGLSITQRLVELMGGHIGFRSTVDVGSQFWFTLPLVEVAPPLPAMEENDAQVDTSATAKKFLIVDDHPINRLLVRQILTNRWKQCDLVEADNGVKALEVLRHQSFDVVLMDMVMPEMDGIEATYELRTRFPLPTCNTPVLGLTANVNQADLGRFTAAGVNALVLKPFDATQLCEQIETLLTEKKSSQGS